MGVSQPTNPAEPGIRAAPEIACGSRTDMGRELANSAPWCPLFPLLPPKAASGRASGWTLAGLWTPSFGGQTSLSGGGWFSSHQPQGPCASGSSKAWSLCRRL